MEKYYATKGKIPRLGEIWQPVGDKLQLFMIHLFNIDDVRPYVPDEFSIVQVLPGKTVGYMFNGYFGPESTLEYHEFIIAPALVKANGHYGFFITHMYVDNDKSVTGGRAMGLPKVKVSVSWEGKNRDRVDICKENAPLISISYQKKRGSLPFTGRASILSLIGNNLFFCRNKLLAKWSLCSVSYSIPGNSCLSQDFKYLNPGRPILSIAGKHMHGEMGTDQRLIRLSPQTDIISL